MSLSFNTIAIALAAYLLTATFANAADWNLPVDISSGTTKTGVVLGISTNATNGFDAGLDSPIPFTDETLNAYFSHPDWNITTAGTPVTTFHRDIRGTLPQTFSLRVKTTLSPLTFSWDRGLIPSNIQATLKANGETIEMNKRANYTFSPATQLSIIDIEITAGDTTPPAAPTNLQFSIKESSIYLTWDAGQETDLAGYRLHLLDANGTTTRTVDLKNVTNYNLMNVINDTPYTLAVSAYDRSGNEGARSSVITAVKVTKQAAKPGNGDMDGDGKITIADAIRILRISTGKDQATAEAKARGDLDGDGSITVRDAILALRKSIGLN